MSPYAVTTSNLTKTYPQQKGWRRLQKSGGTQAVRGIDLHIEHGEMFGLLGPNGAGKTTLVKMLCTLILPTDGTATVAGYALSDESAIKRDVGLVVTDERSFYWRLSARRNLTFFAAMHGLHGAEATKRVDEALEAVQLSDRADSRFSEFSTGMRQRMAIARGLLHRPKILFLDEPTRSLDPGSTDRLHDNINAIRDERNMTVVLITHDLGEAEKMCDRVAVMHAGQIRGMGSSAELRAMAQPWRDYVIEVDMISAELKQTILTIQPSATVAANSVSLRSNPDDLALDQMLACLQAHGAKVLGMNSAEPTLKDVFSELSSPPPNDK